MKRNANFRNAEKAGMIPPFLKENCSPVLQKGEERRFFVKTALQQMEQELHKTLEARIAGFLGTDDAILYSSCFDANGGLFETLLGPEDAVVSDELNHASIIDGIRLCKAKRYRYRNSDMGL